MIGSFQKCRKIQFSKLLLRERGQEGWRGGGGRGGEDTGAWRRSVWIPSEKLTLPNKYAGVTRLTKLKI